MATINTFIPSESIASFKKFADKTKKNVEGFEYTLGKPYQKVFIHHTIVEDGHAGKSIKRFHEVCDLTINMPEESDWRLVATYKNGSFTPADPTKEVKFKNSQHGENYGKCDFCGHPCKNSYVVYNVKTGEEMQVGCECIKKFGLKNVGFISEFTKKLNEVYDYRISYATDDEFGDLLPVWGGSDKSSWYDAILKAELITAAKAQYDICPIWKKAEKIGMVYHRSATAEAIWSNLNCDKIKVDKAYAEKVCKFGNEIKPQSEFEKELLKVAKDFYCFREQIVYAFFLVKKYEDSLKPELQIKKGMQVKVSGKIIQKRFEESYYGTMEINTILSDTGVTCERIGKIPTVEENGVTKTVFYAIVKGLFHGKVCLDKATKNPKKGIEVVEI